MSKDEELRKAILRKLFDVQALSFGKGSAMNDVRVQATDDIMALIHSHVIEASKYQTYVYKQHHPRMEAEGKEIWGIRIAYQGECIYGDIAGSEKDAKDKLEVELQKLKEGKS